MKTLERRPTVDELEAHLEADALYLYPVVDGRTPPEVRIGRDDLETWFNASEYDVPEPLRAAVRRIAFPRPERDVIVVTNRDLGELRDEAIVAVLAFNDPPTLYHQGGYVAEVYATEDHTHTIRVLDTTRMRDRLSEVAAWRKRSGDGLVPTKPDLDAAKVLLTTPSLRLPPLAAITEIPVLRSDGKFTTRMGYDRLARVYFAPSTELGRFDVPEHVTRDDVVHALRLLDQMIGEFPFVERSDKVNTLAFMLTPMLRPVIKGPTPMAAISAPKPGTGKTLLVESIVRMLVGKAPPVLRLSTDENEVEKRITAHLRKGPQFSFLDNVPTGAMFDSAAVAAVLTSTLWSGRVIMSSQMPDLPNAATWVATGNNLTLGPEIARRCFLIELDAQVENPEDREFDIDLQNWVPEHRRELLRAVMVLILAWTDRNMPLASGPNLGSFEDWCAVVGGVIETVGDITGVQFPFLGNEGRKRGEMTADVNDERAYWLRAIYDVLGDDGWTVRELFASTRGGSAAMLQALPVDPSEPGSAKAFGYECRSAAKAPCGGFRLENIEKNTHRGGTVWRVVGLKGA